MQGLVPVKTGPAAKRRLAHLLPPSARSELALAMLGHVLAQLRRCGVEPAVVASGAVPGAEADVLIDNRRGLNGAVSAALDRVALPVVVCVADLPWLAAGDVARLLDEPGDVVVVPTRDRGTGALLMRRRAPLRFGPESSLAHAHAARAAGRRVRVVPIPGFADDLDDDAALVRARALPWVAAIAGAGTPIAYASAGERLP